MPSTATTHLQALLEDAAELNTAHQNLRTGARGRQWGLGAINRATVVLCVSAWEAYVEELAKEGLAGLRPDGTADAAWAAVTAPALAQIKRFNTPDAGQTKSLIASCLGLVDVTSAWHWRNCTVANAAQYLNEALQLRHQVAHGARPRPTVHNTYARWLPSFFMNLARCSDASVSNHIAGLAGRAPW